MYFSRLHCLEKFTMFLSNLVHIKQCCSYKRWRDVMETHSATCTTESQTWTHLQVDINCLHIK